MFSYDDTTGTLQQTTNTTNSQASNDIDAVNPVPMMTIYNNKLVFWANNASGKSKLYSYDDLTGKVAQITNIKGNAADDQPWLAGSNGVTVPAVFANRFFFNAYSGTGTGVKTWSFCDPGAGCSGP